MNDLLEFGWYPVFNNTYELKGEKGWEETNFPEVKGVSAKKAWAGMPEQMAEYIKKMPEYDEEIFIKIIEENI